MDTPLITKDIKRRVFLAGIVGSLVGIPIAARFITRNRSGSSHYFSKTLAKYQSLLDVPVKTIAAPDPTALPFAPPAGGQWKYVIFLKTFLPKEYSNALGGEPDAFLLREGNLFFTRTNKGQEVFTGGDSLSQVCTAVYTNDRRASEIAVLFKENRLIPAKANGRPAPGVFDTQFERLLFLQSQPKALSIGNRWNEKGGRVKPFEGFSTDYEIAGFSEIGRQKTVEVQFSAKMPNIAGRSGITSRKMESGEVLKNEHHGHAWFDTETGMLVRQEIDMDIACGHPGTASKNKDGDKLLHIKANATIQLFQV